MPRKNTPDGFESGVSFGGLREKNDIKLLICYLLASTEKGISEGILNEALTANELANYFKVGEALSELVSSGTLAVNFENGERFYLVTEKSSGLTDEIETSLPYSVREKALNTALMLISKKRSAGQTEVTFERCDVGVTVTLKIFDRDTTLLSLSLLVADELQAIKVRENFLADPSIVFSGVTALLARQPVILEKMIRSLPEVSN